MEHSDDRFYCQVSTLTVNSTAVPLLACLLVKNAKHTVYTDLMVSDAGICSGSALFSTLIENTCLKLECYRLIRKKNERSIVH